MGTLVVGGILFGIILGQFFKCFILVPASGLAIVLVLICPANTAHSVLGLLSQIAAVITSIEIGYLLGSAASFFLHELTLRRAAVEAAQGAKVSRLEMNSTCGSHPAAQGHSVIERANGRFVILSGADNQVRLNGHIDSSFVKVEGFEDSITNRGPSTQLH